MTLKFKDLVILSNFMQQPNTYIKTRGKKHVIYMISPLNNVLCKLDKWITKSHTHSIFPEAYNCLHLN